MKVSFKHKGSFSKTESFLKRNSRKDFSSLLQRYGELGVEALKKATPVRSGLTRDSWAFAVSHENGKWTISWYNTRMAGSVPLVILIQYGHGTNGGAYVQGIDFINPAMKSILDKIADDIWMEVTRQ